MSDTFWQDDQQNQSESNGMKSLREAYGAQKEENAKLMQRLEQLEADARKRTVASFLPAGINPKVADLIPPTVEAKAESVQAWLAGFADVFTPGAPAAGDAGDPASGQADTSGSTQPPTGLPPLPPEWVQAMTRLTTGESGAQEMTRFAGELERARAAAETAGSFDDFRRAVTGG